MDIRIKGFIESSCSDWPGQVAAVIFLSGCNFRCPYCHNYPLVISPDEGKTFSLDYVFQRLASLHSWLDGVCVSGGEPTLSAGLPELCGKIKDAGLLCKLDTNGSRPRVIQELLAAGLVDFISMDVKAPLRADSYDRCAGVKVDLASIRKSMEAIRNADIAYQFRTTYHPELLSESELKELFSLFAENETIVLQKACPHGALDPVFRALSEVTDKQYQIVTHLMQRSAKKITGTEIRG